MNATQRMEILAIIPAKTDSKRLKDKNILSFCGKPLITHTIDEAVKSSYINHIVVSSDNEFVRKIVNDYTSNKKIEYEFQEDIKNDSNQITREIDGIRKKYPHDAYILLQPTSPLRTNEQIDKCIEMFVNTKVDSLITVKEVSPHTFYPNGAIYVFKEKIYGVKNTIFVLMSQDESIDINTEIDFKICEELMKRDGRYI